MQTIWNVKRDVAGLDEVIHPMFPAGSKILSAVNQYERLVIYALVPDTKAPIIQYPIGVFGTGHHIEPSAAIAGFLGTVQFAGGSLVLHVFDLSETS